MSFNENTETAPEDISKVRNKKSGIALAIFLISAALCLAATGVKSLITTGTDLLSGKAAVERFFWGNVVRLIIMVLILIAFVIVAIKTWKGKKTPIDQVASNLVTLLMIVFYLVRAILPVIKIANELKAPKTIFLNSYTLCMNSKDEHFVAFNDDGAVLLMIPQEKYNELQKGNASNKKSAGQAHQIVVDDGYDNIQYYESDITISYYNKSIIYESAALKTS